MTKANNQFYNRDEILLVGGTLPKDLVVRLVGEYFPMVNVDEFPPDKSYLDIIVKRLHGEATIPRAIILHQDIRNRGSWCCVAKSRGIPIYLFRDGSYQKLK